MKWFRIVLAVTAFGAACSQHAHAQSVNRSIAVSVAALGAYGAFGSAECLDGAGPRLRNGKCGGRRDFFTGELRLTSPTRRGTQVAGGLIVAGIGAAFAAWPRSRVTEATTYLLVGAGMVAGAFDYRCRGTRTRFAGCIDTNVHGDRFGESGSYGTFERPSLAWGGLGVAGLGLLRLFTDDAPMRRVQVAPLAGGAFVGVEF